MVVHVSAVYIIISCPGIYYINLKIKIKIDLVSISFWGDLDPLRSMESYTGFYDFEIQLNKPSLISWVEFEAEGILLGDLGSGKPIFFKKFSVEK